MAQILSTRNIEGILIPVIFTTPKIDIPLRNFSVVAIGHRVDDPPLHFVSNDHHATVLLACHKMTELGYKRIGLILPKYIDDRIECRFSGAYLAWQQRISESRRLPILFYDEVMDESAIERWLTKSRPDSVLFLEDRCWHALKKIRSIPQVLGVACLDWHANIPDCAGVAQQGEDIGAAAVNMVVQLIHNSEQGIPKKVNAVFIEGSWRNGSSAVKQRR